MPQVTEKCAVRNISLPAALDRRLVAAAQAEDRPISWTVRRAIERYLEETEPVDQGDGEELAA